MTRFQEQTLRGVLFLVLCSLAVLFAWQQFAPAVFRFSLLSGWVLFGLMLLLAAYNLRKKLSFLPIGTSEEWLQFHIYGGWASFLLFAIHLAFRVPDGWFEMCLATVYLIVFVSGVVGLFLSRALPKRMTTRGGEVIFESVPGIRRGLAEQAEALALKAVPTTGATTLADFYSRRLKDFFENRPAVLQQLAGERRALNSLRTEFEDLNRFLHPEERESSKKLLELVEHKDTLDFQYASQLALKLWLFIHIPFTYSLLLFTVIHILLVYSFSGGRL